jgi:polyhydroxybutyrate depolymerase
VQPSPCPARLAAHALALVVVACGDVSSPAETVGTDADAATSGDDTELTTEGGIVTDADSGGGTTESGDPPSESDASSGGPSSSGGDSTTGGPEGPIASAGCGSPPPAEGYLDLTATDGDGVTREYRLITPHDYDPSTTYALVFHYSHDPVGIENIPGALDAAFFAYPTQSETKWGFGWDDRCEGKDVPYFDDMLAHVEASYCIDTRRVFAAGFSWGADHATTLGCCRASKLRAFAPHASNDEYDDPADYTTYWNYELCEHPSSPPATRYTHQIDGDGAYPAPLFDTTSQLYRWLNTCSSSAEPITPAPCVAYDDCVSPVVECAYEGIGHDYNDGWAQDTWDFFASFR